MIEIRQATKGDLYEIKAVLKSAFYRDGKDEIFNEWVALTGGGVPI